MDQQLSKLIKMLKLWLKKNSLEGDLRFYEIEEWLKREEQYLNDAEYVITTEGGLNYLINYGDSTEFYDLIDSYGYYIEMGHSWNFGFYKASLDTTPNVQNNYREKLKDERWQHKREFILDRANYKCEDCGSSGRLEVHHCYYMYGYEPWEYPFDSLRCLCRSCHEKRGLVEQVHRSQLAQLTFEELQIITDIIGRSLLQYDKGELFSFLQALNESRDDLTESFIKLISSKRFPSS